MQRKPLKIFADNMEALLKENDHKVPWTQCGLDYLIALMEREHAKVKKYVWTGRGHARNHVERVHVNKQYRAAMKACLDTANYCMMCYDILTRELDQ